MVLRLSYNHWVLWYCIFVPACCSLVASLWMMLTYALFPRLQTPTMQLVMLQAAAQLLLALAYNIAFFYPPKTGTALCNFQAWAITFSVFLSGFFTALIAFYMVVTIQRKTRFNMSPKRIFAFVAAITLVSGGLAAIPLATDQFADIGARCWIAESEYGRDRRNGVIMRFSTYYGPMWTLIVFIVICYTRLAAYLKNMHNVKTINAQAKFVYRTISVLLMYPVIYIFVWIPLTVIRVTTAVHPGHEIPIEAMGFGVGLLSAEGFLFALVFSKYRAVREEWEKALTRWGREFVPGIVGPPSKEEPLMPETAFYSTGDPAPSADYKSVSMRRLAHGLTSSSPPESSAVTGPQTSVDNSEAPTSSWSISAFFKPAAKAVAERLSLPALSSRTSQFLSTFADLDMDMPEDVEEEAEKSLGDDGLELRPTIVESPLAVSSLDQPEPA